MSIKQAILSDFEIVRYIIRTTISEIYPHYYPKGAVDFFLAHHSDKSITDDISLNRVFICTDEQQKAVGTVTVKENEICRLFVLPVYQGKGYGRKMLDFAEKYILNTYAYVVLDASLPAKCIYLKRGYKETEYNTIKADNGDHLCYDVMIKKL